MTRCVSVLAWHYLAGHKKIVTDLFCTESAICYFVYRTMPLADSFFQKRSLESRDLCFYLKSALYTASELLFLCSERKWHPPHKIRQKISVSYQQLRSQTYCNVSDYLVNIISRASKLFECVLKVSSLCSLPIPKGDPCHIKDTY